jgi:antitoxin component YwqK of YwqJK toxin-antitoxin module
MKTKFLLAFLLFTELILAQHTTDRKIFLDSTYNVTSEATHVYYRIVKEFRPNLPQYLATQYYKTGEKESEGISTSQDVLKEYGIYTSFYKNGNKKSIITFDDHSAKNGECMYWYENGDLRFEGQYIKSVTKLTKGDKSDSTLSIKNYWNSDKIQTVTDGFGDFTDDGNFDNSDTHSVSSGKVGNGLKNDVWTGSNTKLGITFTENYINGKIISAKSIDKNGSEFLYTEVEKRPEPIGGMKVFYSYIQRNFKIQDDIRGMTTVTTQFTVNSIGKISDVRNIGGSGKKSNEEAIRIISEFRSFEPGKFRGIDVDGILTIPLTFYGEQ